MALHWPPCCYVCVYKSCLGPTFAMIINVIPVVDTPTVLHQDPQYGVALPGT